MTRPIANPAHAPARTRRRQRPLTLLRSALLATLLATCLLAVPAVTGALHGAGLQVLGPGNVESQVAMSGLEPGACMSFAPALDQTAKTVFIDPGHGGLDPGVVGESGGHTVLEKDVALAVGMRLAALLEGDGYRAVLSRTKDTLVTSLAAADSASGALTASAVHRDLLARAACANTANASALLSIHFDAFGDPSVGGTETFYDGVRSFVSDNRRLASDVQRALVSALGTNDRGIWTDDELVAPTLTSSGSTYGHLIELGPAEAGYVDDPSSMPGALVEPLFLTNEAEARLASSESGQQQMAGALKDGLEKYLAGS